ncbi:hypothetical protein V8C86DRAFT_2531749 [Haematococcus lacustris]
MSCVDVAVCGGGLGGLAVTLGLRQRGFDAHVYEAAPQLRTATGTIVGLGSNAFTALDALDPRILPALLPRGSKNMNSVTCVKEDPQAPGQPVNRIAHGHTFRWSEVQNVLACLLPPEAVHCEHRVTGFTDTASQPGRQGRITLHFKGQPDVYARMVVAADGLRSALRAALLPQDPGLRYLGHMNWNALLYNPEGSQVVEAHRPGDLLININAPPMDLDKMWTLMTYVIDAGGGYTFWQARHLSETLAFTQPAPQTSSSSSSSSSSKGPAVGSGSEPGAEGKGLSSSGAAATPLASGKLPGEKEDMPQLVGGGMGVPGSKARVLQLLADAGFEDVARVVQATPEADIFERAMLDRIPLDELGAGLSGAGGRLLLLGDAAHAMHSGPGQGARMAFEDAHQLVEALQRHRDRLLGWQHLPSGAVAPQQQPTPPVEDVHEGLHGLQLRPTASKAQPDSARALGAGLEPASAGEQPSGDSAGSAPRDAERTSDEAGDAAAMADVAREYDEARLVRVCRVARVAAECSGLRELTAHLRSAAGVTSKEEALERLFTMSTWLNKYPECPRGDPDSVWYKPEAGTVAT